MGAGVCAALAETRTVGSVIQFWHDKGIQIVPAKRGDKFPSLKWRDYIEAEQLGYSETLALFGGDENADAGLFNYAVLTGIPSGGLVVLDFDRSDRGMAHPVDTLTVETGKGIHYYIRVRGDARIGNSAFSRASLDIRGVGGIAIAPPSLHPSGAFYRLVNDKPILEVTEEWYRSYLATALAGFGEDSVQGARVRPDGWFAETFTEECGQGGRDNTATALVGKLLNSLYSDDVRAIMYVWAESKCDPPLPRQDIDRIVSSLERKRRFDNEVRAKADEGATTQLVDTLPPISNGPEDAIFRGLGDAARNRREGQGDGA